MELNEDLTIIHAYLCADGYVTRHSPTQNHKYYKLGLRNTNYTLLKDFHDRFNRYFKVCPNLYIGQRCEKGSRKIYENMTNSFGSFYSYEWKMPKMDNEKLIKLWLRTYFDCEGWVFCKSHQNRHVGVDCVNEHALNQVKKELEKFGIRIIKKVVKDGKMFRLLIYGKENIIKFQKEVNFNHPDKKVKLQEAISDFVDYNWKIENNSESIRSILLEKVTIKKPYLVRIFSREERNLKI